MANILQKIQSYTKSTVEKVKTPKLAPGTVDSELVPDVDYQVKEYVPTEHEQGILDLLNARFVRGFEARLLIEPTWWNSWAAERGDFWRVRNTQSGDWDLIGPFGEARTEDEKVTWTSRNLIKPLVLRTQARVLLSKPTITCAPSTNAPRDILAAAEGRSVLAHCYRYLDDQAHLHKATLWSMTTGPTYRKCWWDQTASAEVPTFSQGVLTGARLAPVGNYCEETVSALEIYLDPAAMEWKDVRWLIHCRLVPLSYVQARYGDKFKKRGWHVAPDGGTDPNGVQSRMSFTTGDSLRLRESMKHCVLLKEMWVKPCPLYTSGLIVVVANNVLLREDPWPDYLAARGKFPFARLAFNEAVGTCAGQNAVQDLIEANRSVNTLLSGALDWMAESSYSILAKRGSQIGVDAYAGSGLKKIIYYGDASNPDPALPLPQLQPTPPLPQEYLGLIQLDHQLMQTMAGVSDVSQGNLPAGSITAAQAINLLQQADASQTAEFLSNLCSYMLELAELRIIHFAANAKTPRLVEIDDVADDPNKAMSKVMSFKALNAGGSCRCVLSPGTGIAETPAAKEDRFMRYYQAGLLGVPGTPSSIKAYHELVGETISDKTLELIGQAWQEGMQAQIQPQQQAGQMEQSLMQQKLQQTQQIEQIKTQGVLERLKLQQDHEAQKLALDHQHEENQTKLKHVHEIGLKAIDHHHEETLTHVEHTHELDLANAPPKLALSGKLDPFAVADIERLYGLAHDPNPSNPYQATPPPADKSQ